MSDRSPTGPGWLRDASERLRQTTRKQRYAVVGSVAALALLIFWREMFIALAFSAGVLLLGYQLLVADILHPRPDDFDDDLDDDDDPDEPAADDAGPGDRPIDEAPLPEPAPVVPSVAAPKEGSWYCRALYLAEAEGGVRSDSVSLGEWVEGYHGGRSDYGLRPLYDPARFYLCGDEPYVLRMTEAGVKPFACEYLGPDGCLLPPEVRPAACREFRPA